MIAYVARRLLLAIPTLLGVATVVFIALRMLPGDPARTVVGLQATPEQIAQARHNLGLDQPLPVQYIHYLGQLAVGNLGNSSTTGSPVVEEIAARLPYTVQLTIVATLISAAVGISLGLLAALHRNTVIDLLISAFAVVGLSVPVYWLGLMLIIVFAVKLHWLPSGGSFAPSSVILPSVTLGAFATGLVARMTRASILEVLQQDFVRTARAKGASRFRQVVRHALRNALLPVITIIGLQFGQLLGGAVLTETVFSWPGIGRLLVDSILTRDYSVVQGVILVFAALFILVNIVVDLAYAVADPRIRFR